MDPLKYFCGVDVSKDFFSVAVKNGKFVVKDKIFAMDKEEFEGFERIVKDFKEELLIGMESTEIFNFLTKKRSEGKSYKEAVIATSTKLLRTIYALLNENRCFK
ncbi:MAG: hypothetical protein NC820_07215 [Candidatus Omnitrophica bacterium]|nr:hypothetical protein [Candidatus Omnitrophota bacterium]